MLTTIEAMPHSLQLVLLVIPAISTILAAAALLLNIYQARRTNGQARRALVAESLKGLTDDKEVQRTFYSIEYGEFLYSADFHKSERERQLDKLLIHFANLALSWKSGLLTTGGLQPVQYYILRVMRDPAVLKYMEFLESWKEQARVGPHPYPALLALSDQLSKAVARDV
jgi:hypothetical protein